MLNKATNLVNKQMEQRKELANKANAVIRDAQEALKVLGFEAVSEDQIFAETKEVTPIIINKGHIVEVQTVKEVYVTNDEELDRLYEENARHIRRINELTDESIQLENEISFKDGQIIGLNKQVKELEDKVAELQEVLNAKKLTKKEKVQKMFDNVEDIDDVPFDEPKEEPKPNKGGGAVDPKLAAMLEQVKRAEEIKKRNMSMSTAELIKEATEKAKADEAKAQQAKEEKQQELPEYEFNYEEFTYNKAKQGATYYGIKGNVTLRGKQYMFKATNEHNLPYVPGCVVMEDLLAIKEIISLEVDRFSFTNDAQVKVSYDYMNGELPIGGLFRATNKGQIEYHAYSDKYVLVWCPALHKVPMRKLAKNYLDNKPNLWKALEQQKNTKILSDKFIAICKERWPEDFTNDDNDPNQTKDKKHFQITKEQQQPTNDKPAVQSTNDKNAQLAMEVDDLDM